MQILNFNRISIKNRGQTCNVPFHNFCTRGNFPNTGIFLFTLKRFAPNFQNSSLRMFDTNVLVPSPFFEIRSNDFITVKKGGRRGIACARGGRKCTTRTFLLFPPPPPRKWSETWNCYSWAGENKGAWRISSKRHQPLRDLINGVSTIIPPTHSLHPFEFHVYLKILALW